ncbi:MAG: ATP-binding protein, partial [Leptolyngbyaceae cyanobacterium bins.59]|nr:ATP-binding protein [Leptolyngbyaceae cyanobacterium bins.59]
GKLFGTLGFGSRNRSQFTESEKNLFQAICDQIAVALERSQLFAALQRQTEDLLAANRVKDEFLAVLSHELRTPLNPILGWAKLLQSPKVSSDKLQQGLTTIERNAKQQVQLIEDLLDISRIIRGKMTLNFATVILSEPIMAALETVRLAAEAKSIGLEVVFNPLVGATQGDAGRLQQVFWNLLSNAIKFTSIGGKVTVKLEQGLGDDPALNNDEIPFSSSSQPLTPSPSYAQITVTDTGKGIAPDFLPHVFELFRQQDSSTTRSFGGLGLGLAIARQVVEAHGGNIIAASAGEGQGATFTVQLPLISAPSSSTPQPPQSLPLSLKNLRVMVVDDEVDSLDLVKIVLEGEGASVEVATSAMAALRTLAQSQFDLLISDIGMPEMNGYTFIRQVRSFLPQINRSIPAIALTAYAGETNQRQILAAGFQTHLEKPIDPQHLLDAIVAYFTLN